MASSENNFEARLSAVIAEMGRVAMSIVVTVGFFYILIKWMALKVDGGTNEVLTMMVGSLTTAFGLVINYWLGSSSGSADSRRSQAALTERLADATAASIPANGKAAPWWSLLTDDEKSVITNAGTSDAQVKAFADHAAAGTATPEELAYVVKAGLISQDRAATIAAMK